VLDLQVLCEPRRSTAQALVSLIAVHEDGASKKSTVYDWYNQFNVVKSNWKMRREATVYSQPLSQWLRVALLTRSN